MRIIEKSIADIKPYENNPRNNEAAVPYLANCIKAFGFQVPILIDKNNVIISGHTRVLAAKKLGMKTIPCKLVDNLTPAEVKAFRLADNKVSEMSDWNYTRTDRELIDLRDLFNQGDFDLDMGSFGFDMQFDESNEDFSSFFKPAPPKETQQDEVITGENYGTDFELPDGNKPNECSMTFHVYAQQKELIQTALHEVGEPTETFGNPNKAGNALYEVVRQWVEQKK